MKDLDMVFLLDFYGNMLTDRQREIMGMYYNDDLSLGEISEIVGITRQGVRDNIKRSEKELENLESRLSLVQRFKNIEHKIDNLRSVLTELKIDKEVIKLIDDIYDEV